MYYNLIRDWYDFDDVRMFLKGYILSLTFAIGKYRKKIDRSFSQLRSGRGVKHDVTED